MKQALRPSLPFLVVLLILFLPSAWLIAENPPDSTEPRLLTEDAFVFPQRALFSDSVAAGYAVVRGIVETDGTMSDMICLQASHHAFAEAAIRGLAKSAFEPATENGVPSRVITTLTIAFSSTDNFFIHNLVDDVNQKMMLDLDTRYGFEQAKLSELDEPIRPATDVQPIVITDEQNQVVTGEALLEFYVDRDGTPRLIKVIKSTDERVSGAAVETLSRTTFVPPRKDGKPAPVLVRMPFRVR